MADFTCEHCGGTFGRFPNRTEADVIKEYEKEFSEKERADTEGMVIVCDDCYWLLIGEAHG